MSKDRYANVDWSKNDPEIAKEVGVTKQRIHQVRKERGIPRAKKKTMVDKVLEVYEPGMTYKDLAEESSLTEVQVRNAMYKASEIDGFNPEIKLRNGDQGNHGQYDWDSVDWANEKNTEIAERLGCHPVTVSFRRRGNAKSPHFRFPKEKKDD